MPRYKRNNSEATVGDGSPEDFPEKRSAHFREPDDPQPGSEQDILNQEQLQTARAALWHQNGEPLATYDDAAPWLESIGYCLFLPRPAQFPAPAPSFVEACLGAASAAPAASAINHAMELATRLIDAGLALPLNLLGSFSEQPDFLITTDLLPWVAAVRGDRQWKTAPGGRTSPIVLRTWEALAEHGAQTAIELRERLGREVTEAATLRAVIELWTTLRAIPLYTAGEPTRWQLLKDRHAAALTTAANTAQPTALSALLSVYLRSAVAARAEEAEVLLSPLTARSRIREVLHGMTAARQFGTMSVGPNTLLFVEGSLPETAETPEPVASAEEAGTQRTAEHREPHEERPRRPWQKPGGGFRDRAPRTGPPRGDQGRSGPRREAGTGQRREPGQERRAGSGRPPFRKGPPRSFAAQGEDRPRTERREGERPPYRSAGKFTGGERRETRPPRGDRPQRQDRPGGEKRFGKPFGKDRAFGGGRKSAAKPGFSGPRPDRPRFEKKEGEGRPQEFRPARRTPGKFGKPSFANPGLKKPGFEGTGFRKPDFKRTGFKKPGFAKPGFAGTRPGKPDFKKREAGEGGGEKPRFGKTGFSRPGVSKPGFKKPGFSKPGFSKPGFSKPGFGKPGFGKPGFGKPKFDRPAPGKRQDSAGSSFRGKRETGSGEGKPFRKGPGEFRGKFEGGKGRSERPGQGGPGKFPPSGQAKRFGQAKNGPPKKFGRNPRPGAGSPRRNPGQKPGKEESSE